MNPVERTVRRVDRAQQRYRVPAFIFGVIKKYGDDNGGMLAAAPQTPRTPEDIAPPARAGEQHGNAD